MSLSGLDVEKKRGEDVPPVTRSVAQMAHGEENFENEPYSTGNCLVSLVSSCCNSVCAFAPVFSEKSVIFSAKVAKT